MDARVAAKGYLSGRELTDTFQMLRANDLIWSVAVNRYLLGKDPPAFEQRCDAGPGGAPQLDGAQALHRKQADPAESAQRRGRPARPRTRQG